MVLLHPAHFLRNTIALFDGRAFRVESGEFGLRLHVHSAWSPDFGRYMKRYDIKEIRVSDGATLDDSITNLDFLSEIHPLEGFSASTYRIADYSPIYEHKELRAIGLPLGLGGENKSFKFDAFDEIECILIGEKIKNQLDVFGCKKLKRLSIAKLPKGLSSDHFGALFQLEYLSVAESGIDEIQGLGPLEGLTEVRLLSLRNLRSLEGVEGSSAKLRKVQLDGCPNICDLKPISGARNLEELYVNDCGSIPSLAPINGMEKLMILAFGGGTNILDGKVSFLRNMPGLKDIRGVHRAHYDLNRDEFDLLCGRKK